MCVFMPRESNKSAISLEPLASPGAADDDRKGKSSAVSSSKASSTNANLKHNSYFTQSNANKWPVS